MNDYPFVDTSASSIEEKLLATYEQITGSSLHPASPERLFISWVAAVLVQAYSAINHAANQNLPSRATGEYLDRLGELFFGVERPQNSPAVCRVRFFISETQSVDVVIPKSTRCTDSSRSVYFQTVGEAIIHAGQSSVDVDMVCMTPGTIGNGYAPGSINTIVDVYEYYSRCENLTESGGGSNVASDSEYYELLRASVGAYSVAGPIDAYVYHAKHVSTEIADVRVVTPDAGQIAIYALMADGTPASQTVKDQILAACSADDVRPLTDVVSVLDPGEVPFSVDMTYYIQSGAVESVVSSSVAAAVDDYIAWQQARLGRDINPSVLVSKVMSVEGVKRVAVASPAYQSIGDGSHGEAVRVAQVKSRLVRNGGYEDD